MKTIEQWAIEFVEEKNKASQFKRYRHEIKCEVASESFVVHGVEIPGEPPCRFDEKTKQDQSKWCDMCKANLENYKQWKKQRRRVYTCFTGLKRAVERQQKASEK